MIDMSTKNTEIVFEKTKMRQRRKYEKIRDQKNLDEDPSQKKKHVINLAKHKLTEDETSILKKGLNFATIPKSIPKTDFIAGVETAIRRRKALKDTEAEKIRTSLASVIPHANHRNRTYQRTRYTR